MNDKKSDIFVSLVTVGGPDNSEQVEEDIRQAIEFLSTHYSNFELVIVDNGFSKPALTIVQTLLNELICIRVIRVSRQIDFDTAAFCGIEAAIGDYVTLYEIGVDPIGEIARFVDELVSGADLVEGLNSQKDNSRIRNMFRGLFFWIWKFAAGFKIPNNSTYFVGFSRRAVNIMAANSTGLKYIRQLIRHIGFEVIELSYKQNSKNQRLKRPGFFEAIEVITNYSLRPLRLVALSGLIAALVNLIYSIYVLVMFFSQPVERGWTTTNLQLGLMFFILFVSIAVMSEYLGRVISNTNFGQGYFIIEELVSRQLIADENRRNIA